MLSLYWALVYFTTHSGLQLHLFCCNSQDFVFYGSVVFHHIYAPYFLYSIISQQTSRLISYLGYCVKIPLFFFIYSSAAGYLSSFHNLTIMNSSSINMKLQTSLQYVDFKSFGQITRNGIGGSYSNFISQNACINLYSQD